MFEPLFTAFHQVGCEGSADFINSDVVGLNLSALLEPLTWDTHLAIDNNKGTSCEPRSHRRGNSVAFGRNLLTEPLARLSLDGVCD